jgi:hypothetical protein
MRDCAFAGRVVVVRLYYRLIGEDKQGVLEVLEDASEVFTREAQARQAGLCAPAKILRIPIFREFEALARSIEHKKKWKLTPFT